MSEKKKQIRRLRPGQLDGLVLVFLRTHKKELPLTPGAVGKGIGRSSGSARQEGSSRL
jgi:hypothetical protein